MLTQAELTEPEFDNEELYIAVDYDEAGPTGPGYCLRLYAHQIVKHRGHWIMVQREADLDSDKPNILSGLRSQFFRKAY